eukprot:gnl/MRDRNA2_/MRDRNA2_77791_c0_seq2.p1 gnl/MRDRNA2_/MRDRNA2_77791_c0~~gnl/MRDRNA2_/MRDRNA2_77791_c0_seq2.p1  ORF type:complete len:214 (-),score=20.10 gnl/MRDRNA2_/MRDRNA2_77791_c0_seq2:183-824(-)
MHNPSLTLAQPLLQKATSRSSFHGFCRFKRLMVNSLLIGLGFAGLWGQVTGIHVRELRPSVQEHIPNGALAQFFGSSGIRLLGSWVPQFPGALATFQASPVFSNRYSIAQKRLYSETVCDAKRVWHPVCCFAQPRKKLPERTVKVVCTGCGTKLYKYHKNGKGSLVKCFEARIAEDFTNGDLQCPSCGKEFARRKLVRGQPAHVIIGGKAKIK